MYRRFNSGFLAIAMFCCPAFGQQPASPAAVSKLASASETAKPQVKTLTNVEAEVLAFEKTMEAAVVRGDLKYVDSISAPDLTFTHGDGWTTGGKPLLVDDRKAFLKRVEDRIYEVRDLDSVKVEAHGDIAITYGRYVAKYRTGEPLHRSDQMWFSVWFERVYSKRDGHWQFVSHRTVHGPTYGPDRESVRDK